MSDGNDGRDESQRGADARAYWRANLRLIAVLLVVWATVSLVFGILLVEPLNRWHFGSLPLGFGSRSRGRSMSSWR